jgi:hypothetical protein
MRGDGSLYDIYTWNGCQPPREMISCWMAYLQIMKGRHSAVTMLVSSYSWTATKKMYRKQIQCIENKIKLKWRLFVLYKFNYSTMLIRTQYPSHFPKPCPFTLHGTKLWLVWVQTAWSSMLPVFLHHPLFPGLAGSLDPAMASWSSLALPTSQEFCSTSCFPTTWCCNP